MFAHCKSLFHAALLVATAACSHAYAQYPEKPVRMVVPLAPGGGSDIVGRIVALGLTDRWGTPVVVDNRPGAGSVVGTTIVAKAAADGYTLLASSSSFAISPALYSRLEYDARRDFTPVTLLASQPSLLVVNAALPARSLQDLVALVRSKPGALSYASAGVGSATHLGTELLLHTAHMQVQHVPYKSAGLATTAVLSGETQVLLTNMASVLPHLAGGKIRALGTSSKERSALAPGVPTLSESGLPGFEYATWYGVFAPAATPAPRIAAIHQAIAGVLARGNIREQLTGQGLQVHALPPREFGRYLDAELKRWESVIKSAGITVN